MKALLKAELYRLRCQKSTAVIAVVSIIVLLFNAASLGLVTGNASWVTDFVEQMFASPAMSYYDESVIQQLEELFATEIPSFSAFMGDTVCGDHLIFLCIFLGCFYLPFYQHGFIRNLAQEADEKKIFIVHSLVWLIYTACLVIGTELMIAPMTLLFFNDLPVGNIGMLILYLICIILILWTVGNGAIFAMIRIRKKRRAFLWTLFYVLFGSGFLYTVLDQTLTLISKSLLAEYFFPIGNLTVLTYGKSLTYLTAALSSVFFSAVFYVLILGSRRKRDLI